MDRRGALAGLAGTVLVIALRPAAAATLPRTETTESAIRRFAGDNPIRPGRVTLDLPPLVENGNTVPLTVSVESAMTPEDHVRRIGVFNERIRSRTSSRFTSGRAPAARRSRHVSGSPTPSASPPSPR